MKSKTLLTLCFIFFTHVAAEAAEPKQEDTPSFIKVCGIDKALHASEFKLTAMDRLVLCQGSMKEKLANSQKIHLKAGRTSLPLMSELFYISAAKKETLCAHDEIKEADCAVILSDKKAEVLISHLQLPSMDVSTTIRCANSPCKIVKRCSVETPISADFRKHKLGDFKKTISDVIGKLTSYYECRKTSKTCDKSELPKQETFTLDEQLVLQSLALKSDSTNAETILNWLAVAQNCKGTCLNAADFFDEYNCKY